MIEWRLVQLKDNVEIFNCYVQIINNFFDTPSAPFSIHQISLTGMETCGVAVGEWFRPTVLARTCKYPLIVHAQLTITL